MLDYIRHVDVRKLGKDEIRQCLLYLNYFGMHKAEVKRTCDSIRKKLIERLAELEGTKTWL